MIYEFYCVNCDAIDEVMRPMEESGLPYTCPECDGDTRRHYVAPAIKTQGEQIPYFHPAFGRVVTDNEAKTEARQRGWVEVGNEDVAKHTAAPTRKSYDSDDYFL